jgi:hypothetical protein
MSGPSCSLQPIADGNAKETRMYVDKKSKPNLVEAQMMWISNEHMLFESVIHRRSFQTQDVHIHEYYFIVNLCDDRKASS